MRFFFRVSNIFKSEETSTAPDASSGDKNRSLLRA